MNQYAVEEIVQERLDELHRLGRTDDAAFDRAARGQDIAGWRRRAGRGLASLAVAVAVPRSDRETTRGRVGAALCIDPCR